MIDIIADDAEFHYTHFCRVVIFVLDPVVVVAWVIFRRLETLDAVIGKDFRSRIVIDVFRKIIQNLFADSVYTGVEIVLEVDVYKRQVYSCSLFCCFTVWIWANSISELNTHSKQKFSRFTLIPS